ncbi:hypothetical protein MPVG_00054 [Micromonas pusilla virus 12T]|uniref:hypothetical protein n=1 Tax=Micromonas pusilla virus 12T TaxID=755272 RepID=UPI0002C11B8C|nr:hypothetical protein MPVG_00054 [Micromonas pusilla virus 12T]AGH30877.1 hypothetical protein MPVG_00054 [Micromonas pusilla virus 12T]
MYIFILWYYHKPYTFSFCILCGDIVPEKSFFWDIKFIYIPPLFVIFCDYFIRDIIMVFKKTLIIFFSPCEVYTFTRGVRVCVPITLCIWRIIKYTTGSNLFSVVMGFKYTCYTMSLFTKKIPRVMYSV